MALLAFFDESAISWQDGPFMIMGGFVGTFGEFGRAADSWQKCLDEPPVVPYFHYREGMGVSKIPSLTRVISNHDLQGVMVTIPHAPFRNRNSKLTKGLVGSRVYDWAFIHAVKGVLQWVDENFPEDEKVDFIFEERREFKACKREVYDPLWEEGLGAWKRAGTCTSEIDKKVAALQMGDLLAGEVLESISIGKYTEAIITLAQARPLLLFDKRPPDVIERALTLHSLGKIMFDQGRKKILDSPRDAVDPAVYEKEYQMLLAINAIAQRDNEMLRKENEILRKRLEKPDEDAPERS